MCTHTHYNNSLKRILYKQNIVLSKMYGHSRRLEYWVYIYIACIRSTVAKFFVALFVNARKQCKIKRSKY